GQDFTIRFHLHPEASAALAQDGETVLLRVGRGAGWRFRARGAAVALEPSVYLGRSGEVRRSQQIVLSGITSTGETAVQWALHKQEHPAKSGAKSG
ncbi:MAG: heparinase II/III family protein, partial [Kiloniellales bacterium]|nr:heparinase II/III family protein [Kiloniellales bacterium]